MPKPAYIICSDLRLEDKQTNRVSYISVLEKVTIDVRSPETSQDESGAVSEVENADVIKREILGSIPFQGAITSTWIVSPEDKGKKFKAKLSFVDDDGKEDHVLSLPDFDITDSAEAYFHRLRINLDGFPPLSRTGIWTILVSIRPFEQENVEWASQGFPIVFESGPGYDEWIKGVQCKMGTGKRQS